MICLLTCLSFIQQPECLSCNARWMLLLSEIVTQFHDKVSKYEVVMLKYAKLLFYWCAVFEVAWLGVRMALGASDLKDTIKNFCLVILAAGFFLAVINNYHTWTWNIINGLKSIAGEATTIVDASDKPFTVGLELAKSLFIKCSGWSPLESLTYILAGMAILICFALISLQIILIKCECIVAMCASSILLGLGATSFLRDYAVNALRYVFAVAFKLMVMQLVIGCRYQLHHPTPNSKRCGLGPDRRHDLVLHHLLLPRQNAA